MPAPILATITLNARLQPMDRGVRFEDPLADFLQAYGLGEVAGGGTALAEDGAIASCDITLTLTNSAPDIQDRILAFLTDLGAPKGSQARFGPDTAARPFGALEGLALALDGACLDAGIECGLDINDTIDALRTALGRTCAFFSYWQGVQGTKLYFYGDSFAAMAAALQPRLVEDPLCEGADMAQIA
jgi:hypothetical protein